MAASCRNAKSFLESGKHIVSFERGPDPPDAIFRVDEETWGVEHTRLFEYVQGSEGELERWAWDASVLRLEEKLNSDTEGYRKTGWILAVFGPSSNKDVREIARAAVEAVKKDDPEMFRDKVYPIRKYGDEPIEHVTLERCKGDNLIHVLSGLSPDSVVPASSHRSSEVRSRVDYAVNRILNESPKSEKPCLPQESLVDRES